MKLYAAAARDRRDFLPRYPPFRAFLRAHWPAIAACDFFTVEALTWSGLTRFYVLFGIALQTRRVEIAGIIRQPHGAWMLQVARNLLDAGDGFLAGKRFLVMCGNSIGENPFVIPISCRPYP